MTIEILISFVDRDSLTGKLTSYAQGDVVRNLSDEVANAFIDAGLAKAYTNLGVAGNISITANGQYDVADYAGATVNVPDFKNLVERSITSVTADMLAGFTIIGGAAFAACGSLISVEIPATVNFIGGMAFYSCTSLRSLTVLAITPPEIDPGILDETSNDLIIYVPAESVDTYKAASEWSSYASKIQAIPSD